MALGNLASLSDKEADRCLYLKNRAAVNLKMENFQAVVDDCTEALEISPNDPKYRSPVQKMSGIRGIRHGGPGLQ